MTLLKFAFAFAATQRLARGKRAVAAEPRAQLSSGADIHRFVCFDFIGVRRRAVFEHDLHIADARITPVSRL
jgi:hypothetical protein